MYEKFIVHTDHATFHWFLFITDPSARLIRWCLRLSEFYYEVNLKKGKVNTQAAQINFSSIRIDEIPHAQTHDLFCHEKRRCLETWGESSGFEINDDVVRIRTSDRGDQIVVPYSLRERE